MKTEEENTKGLRWQPFLLSLEDSEERQRHAENENSQNQRHRTYALFINATRPKTSATDRIPGIIELTTSRTTTEV